MKKLKYYQDLTNNFLLAYEKSVEFFVMYIPQRKEWIDCNISFLQFKHDYYFKEISREDAIQKTDGNLPESMFQQYLDTISENMGCLG